MPDPSGSGTFGRALEDRGRGAYHGAVTDVTDDIQRELDATLAARQELGGRHDRELVAGFADRIQQEIDRRVDERVDARLPARRRAGSVLHPGNLALCIPIVAIAGGIGHLPGLIVAFVALALVFAIAETRR